MKQSARTHWRYRIFASTWLSYAWFYFCRKPFFIAKPALAEELSWDPLLLGFIGSAYLIAYTIGQFIMGWSGTKWGPRILLLTRSILTIGNYGLVHGMFPTNNLNLCYLYQLDIETMGQQS